jgi:transposase
MPHLKPFAPPAQLYVGIDIAAKSFTAAWLTPEAHPSKPRTFDQTPAGYAKLHAALAATAVPPADTLIVLEATGSYWVSFAVTMHALGYRICVVNPAQIAASAKTSTRRNKDDDQDAILITTFARDKYRELHGWTPPPQVYHEVRQRLMTRDALMAMRGASKNQLHALAQWPVQIASAREHLESVLAMLEEQLKQLDEELEAVLRDGAWAASAAHLQSITGIGLVTASWLLVGTVNFTTCRSAEAAAHYAGLAPMKKESGTSVKGREAIGHAGNGRLRTALYMATLSAVQHNEVIKPFYTRLKEGGKAAKVARCACARKLMHLCYAVVTKGQDFDPSYQKLPSSRWTEREPDMKIAA